MKNWIQKANRQEQNKESNLENSVNATNTILFDGKSHVK